MTMSHWFGSLLVLGAAVLGGTSCRGSGGGTVLPDYKKPCPLPLIEEICKPNDCGHNSPVANTFPIDGFSIKPGGCNDEHVQVLPRSLHGGGCGSGADLDVDGDVLIGRRGGKEVCRGEQLAGASFIVRSSFYLPDKKPSTTTMSVSIASVRGFMVKNELGVDERHDGYRLEAGGRSACAPEVAAEMRRQLGLTARETALEIDGYEPDPNDDLVIPVVGELYDANDKVIPNFETGFFNLACVGDALAKTAIYDMREPNNHAKNQSALRLLTGNYCGKARYTMRGVVVEWTKDSGRPMVEATWGGGEATCVTTGRVTQLRNANGDPIDATLLDDALQPPDCKRTDPPSTTPLGKCNAEAWSTAVRKECSEKDELPMPLCAEGLAAADPTDPKVDFTSIIHADQQAIIRIRRRPRPTPR
jgi:hypothetical protein